MPSLSPPQIKTQASTPNVNIANVPSPSRSYDNALPSTKLSTSTYPDTSIFTFLPDLYLLISRLSELRNTPPQTAVNGSGTSAPGAGTQQDGAHRSGNGSGSGGGANGLTQTTSRESHQSARSGVGHDNPSIEVRDLPAHVYGIKKRIAEAKDFVNLRIPDVERSIEEQQAEMRDLQARCHGLRGRLAELGAIAGNGNDTVMSGVEEG